MYVYWKKICTICTIIKQKNVILFKKNIYMDVSDIFICIQYITLVVYALTYLKQKNF